MTGSEFTKTLAVRRTIYSLSKDNFPISRQRVVDLTADVIRNTPSAFNSQTTRAIVLFGNEHNRLWGKFVHDAVKQHAKPDQWPTSEAKIRGFENAYGTVLFFEDQETIENFQKQFATYASMFPEWAANSSGAAQINLWNALALDNVGANLQHYAPLIENEVRKQWGVPTKWKLVAQLVFGTKTAPAGDKEILPETKWLKVFE